MKNNENTATWEQKMGGCRCRKWRKRYGLLSFYWPPPVWYSFIWSPSQPAEPDLQTVTAVIEIDFYNMETEKAYGMGVVKSHGFQLSNEPDIQNAKGITAFALSTRGLCNTMFPLSKWCRETLEKSSGILWDYAKKNVVFSFCFQKGVWQAEATFFLSFVILEKSYWERMKQVINCLLMANLSKNITEDIDAV